MNDDAAKIAARHVTIDMYDCKESRLEQGEVLISSLPHLFQLHGLTIVDCKLFAPGDGQQCFVLVMNEGHFALHVYRGLAYVAADLFLCQPDADPNKLLKALRGLFRPAKYRSTLLKRGDFSDPRDIKPKIKTRTAPLRRLRAIFARRRRDDN